MLRIRLKRMGAKNRPFYRIVVMESRKARTAPFVEEVGHYDPTRQPSALTLDLARVEHWVGRGARPSSAVEKLIRIGREQKAAAEPAPEAAE
jgi:small subunit ribosomal protein S16